MEDFNSWFEENKGGIELRTLYEEYLDLTQDIVNSEDVMDFESWAKEHYDSDNSYRNDYV